MRHGCFGAGSWGITQAALRSECWAASVLPIFRELKRFSIIQ
jgi:hypothetical protein